MKVAFKTFASFKRFQTTIQMQRDLVGSKAILDRVAAINDRMAAAATQEEIDPAVLAEFSEDRSQRLKKVLLRNQKN